MSGDAPALKGPVLVVGAGLLGTSIGLALRRRGIDVALADVNAENIRIATGLGAANLDADALGEEPPTLVVVAVPPDHLAEQIAAALSTHRRRGHRRGQREGRPARRPCGAGSRRRPWPATWAATRWPEASAPDRSPPPPRCSTAGPGP